MHLRPPTGALQSEFAVPYSSQQQQANEVKE
jgi:hypothetical protein